MAEAEAAEEKKVDQFEYMCAQSLTLEELEKEATVWRKRGKHHEPGDWIMACPEPLLKNQKEQTYTWIASPANPGKGGPEVVCHAAWVALMHGRAFDIKGDFSKNSAHKTEALGKEPTEWPVLTFKNGKKPDQKPMEDSDDEDEVPIYFGTPVVFAVRFKSNIYTADTMSDSPALSTRQRMTWSGLKMPMNRAMGKQDKYHTDKMLENDLVNGFDIFKALAKKNKNALK